MAFYVSVKRKKLPDSDLMSLGLSLIVLIYISSSKLTIHSNQV